MEGPATSGGIRIRPALAPVAAERYAKRAPGTSRGTTIRSDRRWMTRSRVGRHPAVGPRPVEPTCSKTRCNSGTVPSPSRARPRAPPRGREPCPPSGDRPRWNGPSRGSTGGRSALHHTVNRRDSDWPPSQSLVLLISILMADRRCSLPSIHIAQLLRKPEGSRSAPECFLH